MCAKQNSRETKTVISIPDLQSRLLCQGINIPVEYLKAAAELIQRSLPKAGRPLSVKCCRGHVFDEINTIICKSGPRKGRRFCKVCSKLRHSRFTKSKTQMSEQYRFRRNQKRRVDEQGIRVRKIGARSKNFRLLPVEEQALILNVKQKSIRRAEINIRKGIRSPSSLDVVLRYKRTRYDFIGDTSTLPPDVQAMLNEERNDEQKWQHIDRRVEWMEPIDLNQEHISRLLATVPYRNIQRKRIGAVITKRSPERGITQRHIKMSPSHFV